MTLTRITSDGITDGTITGTDLTTNIDLVDNQKLRLGTGNDLQIYHDGTTSYIKDTGTGQLKLLSNQFLIQNAAGNANQIICTESGSVDLHYDGSKKFETTSSGSTVSGNLLLDNSSAEINLKAGITGQTGSINWTFNTNDTNYSFINLPYDTRATDGLVVNGGSYSVSIKHGPEYLAKFIADGAVELYHNNVKKFETTSAGITVTGNIAVTGTVDGADIAALSTTVSGKLSNVVEDTTPQLGGNLDCNNKVVTLNDSTGADNNRFKIGNGGDLSIYHNGNHSFIEESGTGALKVLSSNIQLLNAAGNETMIQGTQNGAVELYYDNVKKFETYSNGVNVSGRIQFTDVGLTDVIEVPDGKKITVGSSGDLQIYHDGSGSHITESGTGLLDIDTNTFRVRNTAGNENQITAEANGAVGLYHDNTCRLTTTSNGVDFGTGGANDILCISGQTLHRTGGNGCGLHFSSSVILPTNAAGTTGDQTCSLGNVSNRFTSLNVMQLQVYDRVGSHLKPYSSNTYDLGSTTYRWRNVYTNDLNLSNEGGANDVDGTWGSYTIQEGAEDLFLVNKRSGKKYKFNLTEVA